MRTGNDVHLSLNRYIALALGDEWEVRPAAEEGTGQRPMAQVKATSPQNNDLADLRVSGMNQQFTIYAYPEPDPDSVLNGRVTAARVEDTLLTLFTRGIDEGQPMLVPLYDYDETPWDESSDQRRTVDFARVMDLGVSIQQAPTEEFLFTVLAEVRLGWRRDGVLPSSKKKVASTTPPSFDAH